MLFRALFWIGVVAVLMPREPGLGLPTSARALLPGMKNEIDLDCTDYGKSCTTALDSIDAFRSVAVKSLARVKADIEADERAHPSD